MSKCHASACQKCSQNSSGEKNLRTFLVSTAITDTPENMAYMDRLIQAEKERRRSLTPEARELEDQARAELERRLMFGDGGNL